MIRYIDALELIKQAAELDILHYHKDKNHILVYHNAGKHHPAGWFANEIDYAAKNLMYKQKAFDLLKSKVEERLEMQTLDEKVAFNTVKPEELCEAMIQPYERF